MPPGYIPAAYEAAEELSDVSLAVEERRFSAA